ncbi:hypothetical protein K488DRAFT_78094 [Vararia minispora EC-137]|uniref:Uncharacterized protein n=1 Tax=Vararia minispora EC-137 TaxID=1314806 RepID=A0ACB8QMU5_9AGAM|nr:hypothetical protein K488DRAFT_78094 [Vararia minispora EC-137]
MSTAFHLGNQLDIVPPDVIIEASDGVLFYVHSHRLLALSTNNFDSLLLSLPLNDILRMPEASTIVNILIHSIYGLSSEHFRPSVHDVTTAVDAMHTYGLHVAALLAKGTPAFSLVLSVAPSCPLECFILAAKNELEDLAVAVSPYTLHMKLSDLTDTTAMRIGPIYLRRLFFLHLGRVEALKRILLAPPGPDPDGHECGVFEQRRLRNAWTLAVGSLTWEPKPDLSNGAIDSALRPLAGHLTCQECKESLLDRIREILVQWSLVKVGCLCKYQSGLILRES